MSLGFHLTRYFIVSLAKMKIMTLNFLMFIPLTYFINFCFYGFGWNSENDV